MNQVLDFLQLSNEQFLALFMIVLTVLVTFGLRILGRTQQAIRLEIGMPLIFEQIALLVERADQIFEDITEEYAKEVAETGKDARLLWVADNILKWQKAHLRWLNLDRAEVINWIEVHVLQRKQQG